MAISYLSGGEQPLASQMNAIFEELDSKMTTMLSGKTWLILTGPEINALGVPFGTPFYFVNPNENIRSRLLSPAAVNYDWSDPTDLLSYGYGLAELVIENYDEQVVMPADWVRTDFFRIHNLGESSITVDLNGQSITVPAWGCKTARRKGGTWYTGWNYFNKFVAGDPRCYLYGESPGNKNNVISPAVLFDYVNAFEGRKVVDFGAGWQESGKRIQGGRWESDWTQSIPDMTGYSEKYPAITDGTLVEDLIRHKGTADIEEPDGTEVGEYDFQGHANFVAELSALGISAARDGNNDYALTDTSGDGRVVFLNTSNWLGYGYASAGPSLIPAIKVELPYTIPMAICRREYSHVLTAVDGDAFDYGPSIGITGGGSTYETPRVFINQDQGRTSSLLDARFTGNVGTLKDLNWLWTESGSPYPAHSGADQDTTYGTHLNRSVMLTPVGYVLHTDLQIPGYLLTGDWHGEQATFPSGVKGAMPFIEVEDGYLNIKGHVCLIDGAWPRVEASKHTIFLGPLVSRYFGFKESGRSPFVRANGDEFTLESYSPEVFSKKIAEVPSFKPGGYGFGWVEGANEDNIYIRAKGGTPDTTNLIQFIPLQNEMYNLMAWRVNAIVRCDPLTLKDIHWPIKNFQVMTNINSSTKPDYWSTLDENSRGLILNLDEDYCPPNLYGGWRGDLLAQAESILNRIGVNLLTADDMTPWTDLANTPFKMAVGEINWSISQTPSGTYQAVISSITNIELVERSGDVFRRYERNSNIYTLVSYPQQSINSIRDLVGLEVPSGYKWASVELMESAAALLNIPFRHTNYGVPYTVQVLEFESFDHDIGLSRHFNVTLADIQETCDSLNVFEVAGVETLVAPSATGEWIRKVVPTGYPVQLWGKDWDAQTNNFREDGMTLLPAGIRPLITGYTHYTPDFLPSGFYVSPVKIVSTNANPQTLKRKVNTRTYQGGSAAVLSQTGVSKIAGSFSEADPGAVYQVFEQPQSLV